MIQLRPYAIFCADFPDDQIENGNEIVQFRGRAIAQALADMLKSAGFEVSAEPEVCGEWGWAFTVQAEPGEIRIQIMRAPAQRFFLISDRITPRHPGRYAEILTRLNEDMARDGRFSRMRWFLREQLEQGFPGTDTPVADDSPPPAGLPGSGPSAGLVARILYRLTMPRVRPWVDFHTTITDERIEDHGFTHRDIGKNVVWAVREFMLDLDCVVTPPTRLNEHMWHILILFRGRPSRFAFSYRGNDVRIFCEPPKGLMRYFNDDYRYYTLLVTHLDEKLRGDPRCRDVQWRFPKDLPKGMPGPVWSLHPL